MRHAREAGFPGVRAVAVLLVAVLSASAIFFAGCAVGPNYKRPAAPTATKWDLAEPWREGAPKDALPKGQWWSVFHDDDLNALETQAFTANQTIKISLARLEQARATAAIQVSTLFPTVSTSPGAERQRLSGNRPTNGVPITLRPATQNTFVLPFSVSYEVDLFGRRGPRKCAPAGHVAIGGRLLQPAATGFRAENSDAHGGGFAKRPGVGEFTAQWRRGFRLGCRARRDTAEHHAHPGHFVAAAAQTV